MDLRPNPLYEDSEMALFRTRYYGRIKTYHWVATPLALHGVIYNKNNEKSRFPSAKTKATSLYHNRLAASFGKRADGEKMSEGITGEDLNVVVGSIPFQDDKVSEKLN